VARNNGRTPIWHPGLADYIPSIPESTVDLVGGRERARVAQYDDSVRRRIVFDEKSGVLTCDLFLLGLDWDKLRKVADQCSERREVTEIVLFLAPDVVRQRFDEIIFRGFYREDSRESAESPAMCFAKMGGKVDASRF
jgi:hypothetical protein